jgi:hypothetical protein
VAARVLTVAKRRWQFNLDGEHHVVEFEHGYFRGTRTFIVDGVRTIEPGRPFMDHSGEYPLAVGSRRAMLQISTDGFRYSYDLAIDGRSLATGASAPPPRPPIGPLQRQALGVGLAIWTAVLVPFFWRSRPEGASQREIALVIVLLGAALYFIVNGTRRARVLRRLKEKGQLQPATVVRVKWGYARGIGQVGRVEYEFDDPLGRRRRASGPQMYASEARGYVVGSKTQILVDPDRPRDSALP